MTVVKLYVNLILMNLLIINIKFINDFSLQKVLGLDMLGDIMDEQYILGKHVMHNCLYVNKSGVVTNIETKGKITSYT